MLEPGVHEQLTIKAPILSSELQIFKHYNTIGICYMNWELLMRIVYLE